MYPVKSMMKQMVIPYFALFFICGNNVVDAVRVQEVQAGHLAELPCLSSDDLHRFMYWESIDDNKVIGPGNPYDMEKYNYEVLTGKLLIRGVSTKEAGFYKCVSQGVRDESSVNMELVELIVTTDFETAWENSYETNLLRGLAAVMVVVVVIAVVLFIITMKKRRSTRFFDLEESRETSPARFKETRTIPLASTSQGESGGIDNAALDVDFPKVFKQLQNEPPLS